MPLVFALVLTVLIGGAVRMTPYFAGDVQVARAVQAASPGTAWATAYTRTATAPIKWVVTIIALFLCYAFGGWRGALLFIAALAIEQTVGEPSKLLFLRPRPSHDLIAVVGSPSGYSFPSTFMTFHAVVIGTIGLLALGARPGSGRSLTLIVAPILILAAWACRVTVGAHWPSDVVLTTVLCFAWLVALQQLLPELFAGAQRAPARRRR